MIMPDNQQERLLVRTETNRILRGHMPDMDQESMKIWSDPHGDVGSQAEQKRPGRRT
jgi:hypothetical protein